ncbi:MAG: UvrD-helicase domain-containing protein, partial [Lentisphaerae bacterium]|nr:UvrD-helicase domain-containing protein [Lentisphaerota bacterium]
MSRFMVDLNPAQRRAVCSIKGPLLVLAGAGTGKTRVITHRIAHMLATGISPKAILAVTFTNKAAGEMKERLIRLVPGKASRELTVGTFHSFCVRSLRQFADRIGISKNFGICDADDQLVAIKQALRELQISETEIQPKACLARVSLLKNQLVAPHKFMKSEDDWERLIGRAYMRYDQRLRVSGLLDFDDLLL